MKKKLLTVSGIILMGVILLSLIPGRRNEPPVKCSVLATVEPIGWLVERIGGDFVQVHILVPAGREPETFSPIPSVVASFAQCKVFFRVGLVSEESLLPRLASVAPKMKTVDLREGLDMLKEHESDHVLKEEHDDSSEDPAETHDHESHEHTEKISRDDSQSTEADSHGHHSDSCGSEGLDPHFWMSPQLARMTAQRIAQELILLSPENKDRIEQNYQQLDRDLASLQKEIVAKLHSCSDRILLVYHPAYGYFCREFQLKQLAVESEGKSPRSQDLARLIATIKEHKIKTMIVQPEFNQSSVQMITESTGARSCVHSPLQKNLLDNIRSLGDLL